MAGCAPARRFGAGLGDHRLDAFLVPRVVEGREAVHRLGPLRIHVGMASFLPAARGPGQRLVGQALLTHNDRLRLCKRGSRERSGVSRDSALRICFLQSRFPRRGFLHVYPRARRRPGHHDETCHQHRAAERRQAERVPERSAQALFPHVSPLQEMIAHPALQRHVQHEAPHGRHRRHDMCPHDPPVRRPDDHERNTRYKQGDQRQRRKHAGPRCAPVHPDRHLHEMHGEKGDGRRYQQNPQANVQEHIAHIDERRGAVEQQ